MKRAEQQFLKYAPSWLLDLACSVEGWRLKKKRYTSLSERYYRFYLESAAWSERQLLEFQNNKLRELVAYSVNYVPYYRRLFQEIQVAPSEIQTIDDLVKLPFLDKLKVRQIAEQLIGEQYDLHKLDSGKTGGSTGTPMKLYFSPETWPAQYGFFWARWRPGVTRNDRYACFQGQTLVWQDQDRPPFWRNNYVANQRLYSVFHLKEDNLRYYVKSLNSFRPVYIQGYPSAMYIVADYMKRNRLTFEFPLKAAFSMSESVQDIHKTTIEDVWKCPLQDQYGQGERVASITLFPCGNYHYDMDFGIIEFIPFGYDGPYEIKEIVGTSLINKAWPLIRYKTGDLAVVDTKAKCSCGRPGPVIKKILGRTGDILTMPDGRKIMNITTAVKDIPGLVEFQIVHEKPCLIVINIVRGEGFTIQSEKMIQKNIAEKTGKSVALEMRYLPRIERTSGGKYKAIISKI